jgi:uncharacterized protein YdhG (YjbR/CyaY superfamily)
MTAAEVTSYIEAQDEPKRSTLFAMRQLIMQIEPGLEQVIAWKSAMFKFDGKFVMGLCAHKNHLSCNPQSTEVIHSLTSELTNYVVSKSSFQFGVDQVLPRDLVEKLIRARIAEL